MKKKIKISLSIVGILVILLLVAGLFFWFSMGKPLYEPGMVRDEKNLRASLKPPAASYSPDYWQVEKDIKLYHFSEGTGENVLIVHGGPGYPYASPWQGLQMLKEDYRFQYYDQRGCGRSTRPFTSFTSSNYYENMKSLDMTLGIGAQVADIERIRQILKEDRLIIIGHSYGAFLATLYAAEFPERVKGMILISPADLLVMSEEEGGGLFEEVRKRLPDKMKQEYSEYLKEYLNFADIFSKSEDDLIKLNLNFGKYYMQVIKISFKNFPKQGRPGGWMSFAQYFSMGRSHDYRDALQGLNTPVLILHGKNDLQSEAVSRSYSNIFTNAKFVIMDNSTHFSFVEQPVKFGEVVKDFLKAMK